MQSILFGERTFQLWEFHTTHGFLVIRSPKSDKADTTIDIICTGVDYLETPHYLKNITIKEATLEEIRNMENLLGQVMDNYEFSKLTEYSTDEIIDYKNILGKSIRPFKSVLIVESRGKRFLIVLLAYWIEEHQKGNLYSPFQEYLYGTDKS